MEPISRREALRRTGFLLGGVLSAPIISGVLGGCQASTAEQWSPAALSADQNEMVIAISEHIIPETDTPGAKAVNVNRFIDKLLAEWYPEEARQYFLDGLEEVNAQSQSDFGQPFLELSSDDQVSVLTVMDERAYAEASTDDEAIEDPPERSSTSDRRETNIDSPLDSTEVNSQPPASTEDLPPFFRMMKEMTLTGYYTSEVGATQELQRVVVPGRYDGCVPLAEIGRAWS